MRRAWRWLCDALWDARMAGYTRRHRAEALALVMARRDPFQAWQDEALHLDDFEAWEGSLPAKTIRLAQSMDGGSSRV